MTSRENLDDKVWTPERVRLRLEEAGMSLLSLPPDGEWPPRLRAHWPEFQAEWLAYAAEVTAVKPPRPSSTRIARMDEALGWLPWIMRAKDRRIVALRMLVHPITERHRFSYYRIGRALGLHHNTIKSWEERGLADIAQRLQGLRAAA